jgi:hypothetical protein
MKFQRFPVVVVQDLIYGDVVGAVLQPALTFEPKHVAVYLVLFQ